MADKSGRKKMRNKMLWKSKKANQGRKPNLGVKKKRA